MTKKKRKNERLMFEGGLADFLSFCAKQESENTLEYMRHFLTTLEVNKLEEVNQDEHEPMIYRKLYDQFGLVTEVSLNPDVPEYQDLPLPRTEFTESEYHSTLDRILQAVEDVNLWNKINLMLTFCIIEKEMRDAFIEQRSEEYLMQMPPLIVKKCDAQGYPITYKIGDAYEIKREVQ